MNLECHYESNHFLIQRIVSHAKLGLKENIGDRSATPRNLMETMGNGVLWTTGLVARGVRAIGRSLQDPRVVTVGLTALALVGASFAFYPTTTWLVATKVCTFVAKALAHIPLEYVKFSAYLFVCAKIIGFGMRAEGRFCNEELMKEFYGVSQSREGNPALLFASEIAELRANG